jgi:outer membrane protein
MNLFEGGNTIKKTKVATSTKKNYEYQLKSLESTISNLTKQYYLNVFDGLLQISSLEQSVISAEKFLQAATRSYQVGLKTTTDVLIANENYYNAKRLLSRAKYSFLLSALALKSTVGPLNVEDITNLNQFLRG